MCHCRGVDTSKVENANDALFKAEEVVTGLANKMTVKLSPIIEAIANQFIDAAVESEGFGNSIDKAFNGALAVVGVFADGLHGVQIIFKTLEVAAIGFSALAVKVFEGVTDLIAMSVDGWIMIVNDAIRSMNSMIGTDLEEIPEIKSSKFVTGVTEVAENMIGLVNKTNGELHDLAMQELPSDQLKAFIEKVEVAATKASEILTKKKKKDDKTVDPVIDADAAARAQQAVDDLILLNETKLEEISRFETERKALIAQALADELISKSDHDMALTEIEQHGANARLAIAEAEANAKKAAQQQFFGDLASLMNTGSKKAFAIGKAAALANAGINGVSAAIAAWDAGMSTGGPWAPAVAAAYAGASIAKTGGMMQQISSQSFGSPSSPTSFSGGLPTVNTSGGGGSQQPANNVSVDIVGSEGATFSRDSVIGLIEQINGAVSDGVTLNTGG